MASNFSPKNKSRPRYAAMIRERGGAWETRWQGSETECRRYILDLSDDLLRLPAQLAVIKSGTDPEQDALYWEERLAEDTAPPRYAPQQDHRDASTAARRRQLGGSDA